MNDPVNVQTIITIVGFCITITTFFISRAKEIEDKTEANTKVNMKLDKQCGDIDDIKDGIKESNALINEMIKTQTGHDKDIKNLFHQMEKLDRRVGSLERSTVDDGR